jgi:hypothetical protein
MVHWPGQLGGTVRGSNPGWGAIFRTPPDRTWGPPSLLHNEYPDFPVGKWPGRGVDHPPHLSLRLKKEFYILLTVHVEA